MRYRIKGAGVLEYTMLIIIILASLASFAPYIRNALQGQHRKVGETMAFGRQYAPEGSIECTYDEFVDPDDPKILMKAWYSQACFNNEVIKQGCNRTGDYQACLARVKKGCRRGCSGQ